MRRVIVLEEAVQDLETAKDFYNTQETGVGDYCTDSLLADIESLALLHGIHPLHFSCFRMLATHFPFGVYYLDEDKETQVIAVLDLRREPSWIHREIKRRSK